MRIAVTGDRDFLDAVSTELSLGGAGSVESIDDATDDGNLAFSLAEAATLVAIVGDLLPLCKAVIGAMRRERRPAETPVATQTLRFKTALGTTQVDVPTDITLEELHRQLGSLVRS